jgi:hypothetical protein
MALTHTQGYQDSKKEDEVFRMAERIKAVKDRLLQAKVSLLVTTTAIAADPGAPADLKALGTQAEGFINNSKISDFIDFVTNNIG